MVQQVILAVALFDEAGSLLVDKIGLMPCQTLTDDFNQIALDDEFNTSHPVFQWIFRVTRNWSGISDLIPSMHGHLQSAGRIRNSHCEINDSVRATNFRELFCITAESIAASLNMSLENLGCLYEDVLTIGTTMKYDTTRMSARLGTATPEIKAAINNLELGKITPTVFGKGQMLLLTKTVDNTEAHRLQQLGYRFADVEQVSDNLARSFQMPCGDVEYLMARLHAFSKRQHRVPKKGTYLASFLIQPKPGMKDIDVVVWRANPGRLPMIKLDEDQLEGRQLELLSTFDGLTLDKCLAQIKRSSKLGTGDTAFMQKFRNGIESLLRECPEETLRSARFSAQQLDMVHGQTQFSEAKVFAFCGIKEIYIQSLQSLTLKTIPFSFFNTYLRSQPECVDHDALVKRNRDEFGPVQQARSGAATPTSLGAGRPKNLRKKQSSLSVRSWNAETGSVESRANYRLTRSLTAVSAHLWSGMVMTSIMNISSADCKSDGKGDANMMNKECQTLADRLMFITTSFRGSHSSQGSFRLGVQN
ncbi:hypothetical protein yc1106_03973 [Curvularia clavata]|uniref:Uncharacterized protein n=1 Tax=Curvularia clavata TaxID=95742 RepID=A0A9Q8Z881_CURCL|nr:hypothetical protein yc1106_03973 [Curvularia clavata]